MLRSQRIHNVIHKWLIRACAIGILCILLGCDADVKEECGGTGGFVSCLSIESIAPVDGSNVDAIQGICSTDPTDPTTATPEPFTDHDAVIIFANRQFPGASDPTQLSIDGSLLITIVNYSVTYTLNHCPENALGCPALTGFSASPGQTIVIPPGRTADGTFPFVPLRVKEEYVAEGGQLGSSAFGFPFPSYTANYVFTARTDFFSDDIRIQGAAEFTIGNFNNCSG